MLLKTVAVMAIDFPSIMFESKTVREYSYVILPFQEQYIKSGAIKKIIVSAYKNDLDDNSTREYGDTEYRFDEEGHLIFMSLISDSVAENRYEYSYSEKGFLQEILEQQYTYDQLYKEKRIKVLRLQDENQVRIIQKELSEDEQISTETILKRSNRLIYVFNDGSFEITDAYIFNENKSLKRIERKSVYLLLSDSKEFFTSIEISRDKSNRIIEYRNYNAESETTSFYTFEYDSEGSILKIIETDYAQDGQYKRINNFIEFDQYGNWVRMREDIFQYEEKVSEVFTNRILEYW